MGYKPYSCTLPNGIRIVTQQIDVNPYTNLSVNIPVGNIHFTESQSGLAHLVEHLAFVGTTTKSQDEINQIKKSTLGWLNAQTSDSFTEYLGGAPSNNGIDGFEAIADVISDMIRNSTIPEDRLTHEKNVVVNEMRQRSDEVDRRLDERLNAEVFAGSPYGRRVIGEEAVVKSFTREDCLSVFTKYSADQIVLTATGPNDAEGIASVLIDKFSLLERRPQSVLPPPSRMSSIFLDSGSTDFLLQNHFRALIPLNIGYKSDFHWVPDMMAAVLNERLEASRNKHDFTYGIYAKYFNEPDKSYIAIIGCTHPDTSDCFLTEMAQQIAALKKGFTMDEITRHTQQKIIQLLNIHNNSSDFFKALGQEMMLRGAVFDAEKELSVLDRLRPDDVNNLVKYAMTDEVALGYLGRSRNFMDFDMFRELCGKAETPQFSAKKAFESPRLDISS